MMLPQRPRSVTERLPASAARLASAAAIALACTTTRRLATLVFSSQTRAGVQSSGSSHVSTVS